MTKTATYTNGGRTLPSKDSSKLQNASCSSTRLTKWKGRVSMGDKRLEKTSLTMEDSKLHFTLIDSLGRMISHYPALILPTTNYFLFHLPRYISPSSLYFSSCQLILIPTKFFHLETYFYFFRFGAHLV